MHNFSLKNAAPYILTVNTCSSSKCAFYFLNPCSWNTEVKNLLELDMIWLQSAQSSSSFTTRYLNPHSAHTHTKFRKFNHVTSLSRFWESAVHSSGEMRGVEQPSFHLLGGGWVDFSESVKCIWLYSPNTLLPDASAKMSCLCEGDRIHNWGHWEVHRAVEWILTFAGVLAHVCEPWAAGVRTPLKWHALQQAVMSATFCTHSGMFRSASPDSV